MNDTTKTPNQETTTGCCGMTEESGSPVKCPMAQTCERMLTNARVGIFFLVPGILLFLGGILILLVPKVMVWLMGGTSILLGLLILGVAAFFKKLGAAARSAQPIE